MEDLTNKTFNDLTAVKYVGGGRGSKGSLWEWRCICGSLRIIAAHRVKSGHDMSCGCRRSRDCETIKLCRHCGRESLRKNRHGNFSSVCQTCYNQQTNDFKVRNPAIRMVQSAKIRAGRTGVPFSITAGDVTIPTHCPALGIRLEYGNRHRHENSPSLDKIKPERGYVPGNVAVLSHRANWLKSNATSAELRAVADWMDKQMLAV
jgi:hypothetical protein